MLSYQHGYHAGNLADVHKHSLLAWMVAYLTKKDKPLSYIETHAGRGRYDLSDAAAIKTGEAAQGIEKHLGWFDPDHPYAQALAAHRAQHGPTAYPGSPVIAAHLLRATDTLHLAELHPQEHAALCNTMSPFGAQIYKRDGFETAYALCPPTPRRGLMLIDPSFEVKDDWETIPRHMIRLHKAWNVGVILLWYPILANGIHKGFAGKLRTALPDALHHNVRFSPARPGHGMIGSGLCVVNPPYGLQDEARRLNDRFKSLT